MSDDNKAAMTRTSYGKSPNTMARVLQQSRQLTPMQQSQMMETNRPPRADGGNLPPYFVLKYLPTIGVESDIIRIVPGEYEIEMPLLDYQRDLVFDEEKRPVSQKTVLNYFPVVDHYLKGPAKSKPTYCSGGVFHNYEKYRKPCEGCVATDEDKATKRLAYAYSVLHFGDFIQHDQKDAYGNIKTDKNGDAYKEWRKATRQEMATKYKHLVGTAVHVTHRKLIWLLGYTQWKLLWDQNDLIAQSCLPCGGPIITDAWQCPTCKVAIIDMNNTTLTPTDLRQQTSRPYRCHTCGELNFLEEAFHCEGCPQKIKQSIFDVNLKVRRQAPIRSGDAATTCFDGWQPPSPIPPKLFEGQYPEAKPWPLERVFKPTPMEYQYKIFGVPESVHKQVTREYTKSGRNPAPKLQEALSVSNTANVDHTLDAEYEMEDEIPF